tara:strand:+ start:149 stop:382 length:234 start_codon:yes stop_codon:yes gene_type:complete
MESIKIHGKQYVLVNSRIIEFRTNPQYKGYGLKTKKVKDEWFENKSKDTGELFEDNRVEFKCYIYDPSGNLVSTGTA